MSLRIRVEDCFCTVSILSRFLNPHEAEALYSSLLPKVRAFPRRLWIIDCLELEVALEPFIANLVRLQHKIVRPFDIRCGLIILNVSQPIWDKLEGIHKLRSNRILDAFPRLDHVDDFERIFQ